jgi:hypothetical protein
MLKTIEYLDSLPIYQSTEELPVPWPELSSRAISTSFCFASDGMT